MNVVFFFGFGAPVNVSAPSQIITISNFVFGSNKYMNYMQNSFSGILGRKYDGTGLVQEIIEDLISNNVTLCHIYMAFFRCETFISEIYG